MHSAKASKGGRAACIAVLLALPLVLRCTLTHFCLCGHLAHPRDPAYEIAGDIAWPLLFGWAVLLALRSRMVYRRTFLWLTALVTLFDLLGAPVLGLLLAVSLAVTSLLSLLSRPPKDAG